MGIGSLGSVSFWQQDQTFWQQAQAQDQATTASNDLISAMGSDMANEAKGLASIANKTALARVQSQLTAALQSAVQASQSGSSSSQPSGPTNGAAATGTGTIPLTAGTSLLTLGIPPNGLITVSDGTNTTTYASTGTDTVSDLIDAINTSGPKNANVTAGLDSTGHLVITANNETDSVSVGGVFASDVGFGNKNDSFQPTAPSSNSSSPSNSATGSTSAASTSTGTSASTGSSNTSPGALFNSAVALQTGGTAETLLASSGLTGSLVNLLA